MKITRPLLVLLPLLCLAAASGHQAFGPMRFGMPVDAARTAQQHITQSYRSHKRDSLTAADVRAQFVSSGSLRIARNASIEATTPVFFSYKAEPFVKEVAVVTKAQKEDAYPTEVKQDWETLQDIADGKFSRRDAKGQFPPIEVLTMDNPKAVKGAWAEIVTDTWEHEGVRIELGVRMLPPPPAGSGAVPRAYSVYYPLLRATVVQ